MFQHAVYPRYTKIVGILLPHFKFHKRWACGSNALIIAAKKGHVEIVRILLETGMFNVHAREKNHMSCPAKRVKGKTTHQYAVKHGDERGRKKFPPDLLEMLKPVKKGTCAPASTSASV
ncbi:hypothetical protein BDW74DRAFT_180986 [Aspergillus multicolor]|uniref:uncharacterized protein n=1 Tax=Aspergillus multicolor TaxID=41759 RepID=UPI003CCD2156